nr:GFA family protein [Arsukibacterium sp.]
MASRTEHRGSCLCGAVSVKAATKNNNIGVCHCAMCRKWGGGPLLAVECGTEVEFTGVEQITTFNSSEWAERGFCQHCGTHLFYRLKKEGHYAIPAGLFDNADHWKLTEQIFIDQKPAFYSFAEETKMLTGQQVFDQYS